MKAHAVGKASVSASQLAACLSVDEQHLGFGATQEVSLASASSHHTDSIAFPLKSPKLLIFFKISSRSQAAGAG